MMRSREGVGGAVDVVGVAEVIISGRGVVDGEEVLLDWAALVTVEARGPLVHVVWGT